MASKTVQISARISDEDAEFISNLAIDGSKTPSDKLRAIIVQARQRSIGIQDYTGCYKMVRDLLLPINETIRKHELDQEVHSAFIIRLLEWLPDLVAYAVSSAPTKETENTQAKLETYEQGLVDRVFRFFESVMQMGVGEKNPCYNPEIITLKTEPILNLSTIINSLKK